MKKVFIVALLMIFTSMFTVGCTRIGPGHVGIKVSMAGDNREVQDIPLTTGWVWYLPWATNVYEYATFNQRAVWTKDTQEGSPTNEEITFMSKDNLQFGADVALNYNLIASRVPHFYVQFRSDDLTAFTHGYLKDQVRSSFQRMSEEYTAEEIYGAKNGEFLANVQKELQSRVDSIGIVINQFGTIGALRPPDNIVKAINNKIAAMQDAQRVQNEVVQAQAEAQKKIAEAYGEGASDSTKKALQAAGNLALARSLTPQVIQWEQLQIARQWNGTLPQVMTGNNTPFMVQLPNR